MGPVRGQKRKRKVEKKPEENALASGSTLEGSADWWDVLPNKIASMLSFFPHYFHSRFYFSVVSIFNCVWFIA